MDAPYGEVRAELAPGVTPGSYGLRFVTARSSIIFWLLGERALDAAIDALRAAEIDVSDLDLSRGASRAPAFRNVPVRSGRQRGPNPNSRSRPPIRNPTPMTAKMNPKNNRKPRSRPRQ
jgi:hypothetical protein